MPTYKFAPGPNIDDGDCVVHGEAVTPVDRDGVCQCDVLGDVLPHGHLSSALEGGEHRVIAIAGQYLAAAVPVSHSATGTDDQAAVIQRGDDFVTRSDHLIPDVDAVDFELPGGGVGGPGAESEGGGGRRDGFLVSAAPTAAVRDCPIGDGPRLVFSLRARRESRGGFFHSGGPGVHLCLQQA
jgi:hypothetical protein